MLTLEGRMALALAAEEHRSAAEPLHLLLAAEQVPIVNLSAQPCACSWRATQR
jgi:hypothetical protein